MLHGIHALLGSDLLRELDRLGHGDAVLVADANYPAYSSGAVVIDLAVDAPAALRAIRTVLPVDAHDDASVSLMRSASGETLPVQHQLVEAAAAAVDRIRYSDRHAFYAEARGARLVIRTAETRPYGNLLLRKGVVTPTDDEVPA